jgi:hypothetical protein
MKQFDLKDMTTLVDHFHEKVFPNNNRKYEDCTINILTREYQNAFGNGKGSYFITNRFECHFTYDPVVLHPGPDRRQGINVTFRDTKGTMRGFKKSLQVFLHLYDNPEGYFRLERIMFEIV